jgi:outer membrane protein OmpA-like peptidoglycan-associated protein/tetratricopeptide (TPR) repeat protein
MKRASFIFSVILLSLISNQLFATKLRDNSIDRRKYKEAENLFTYAEFEAALPLYLEMLAKAPDNWKLNYRAGICYYYSTTARPRSVSFLDKALSSSVNDTFPDNLYHAGLAHLAINEFDNAHSCFVSFKKKAGPKYRDEQLDQLIKGCEIGKQLWANPSNARVSNLGANVNSPYPDYAPVVIYRSDILLFTSKRPCNTGKDKDDEGFYYEDIYQAKGESWNRWKEPSRYDTSNVKRRGIFSLLFNKAEIVNEINTEDHDGSITLSPDSSDLYIFRYGDIMKARWNGKRWERPARIGEEIDMRASHEPSIFLSRDGQTLFFVSDRKGGVGNKDIWYCNKTGNNWSKPQNLGMEVNTPFNEDCPFLAPDGNTLYFSSEGHNSMGGYDVFRCTKKSDGRWSEPENLGAPINNGGDDVFYTPLENGSGAYYSTLNKEGEGDLDLYFIQYYPPVVPLVKMRLKATGFSNEEKLTVRVIDRQSKSELHSFVMSPSDSVIYNYAIGSDVEYEIIGNGSTSIETQLPFTNGSDDEYVLQNITVNRTNTETKVDITNNYFRVDETVNRDEVSDPFSELPVIRRNYLDNLNAITSLKTAFTTNTVSATTMTVNTAAASSEIESQKGGLVYFDFNSSEIESSEQIQIVTWYRYWRLNTERTITIVGHADEKGDAVYNQRLSEKRAHAVKMQLVEMGVPAEKINCIGKGESEPVNHQSNEGADRSNRRVQILIQE